MAPGTSYVVILLVTGISAGMLGGLVGIGGGIIVIPALIAFLGFSQHMAQGTSLTMMLPPIGIIAVLAYNRQGFVDWKAAVLLCLGFLLGSILGAKMAISAPQAVLSRIFGVFLVVVGLRMFFKG